MDNSAVEDNHKLIDLEKFAQLTKEHLNHELTEETRNLLYQTSGRISNGIKQINISSIYSTRFLMTVQKMYDNMEVNEADGDELVDPAGYTGIFRRNQPKNQVQISKE